uniref:Uncharacterized protein n=1 Tax=Acrobeloides nanus TaxID=290746 RepID=A0A914CQ70_9BILA
MYDNPCQVTVPYLSKIYVKITDASGTQVHEQQEIIFFNGQALFAGSEGDYLNPNLTYLTSHSSSNSYTGVIYACSSQMNVIQPDIYPIAPSTQICNELSITYIKCDDTAVKYNGTTIVCDNNNAPLQYWAAKLAFEPGPDASTNFTLVPITLGPVYQNFTNNFIVTILFSSVNLDTDNYRDEFVCPNNVSTCQVNAPYRSNIYLNITDSTGMKSYDQQEISFFNGQALLARSEGDYLDPNEVYLSSFISSNTFVGVLYECSKKETIKQPEYYPTETCSNFEADIRFFDKDDNMLADFAMKIYTTFDLTNPVVDNRNISVDVVNILMDPEADPTLYTNIGDACYHL